MPSRSAIVAGALLALHIGNGSPLIGTAALQQKTPPSQVRPAGWSPATHGNQARPDYARLFALDRVHELRISIDAATFRAMREDLKSVLPIGGIPAGLPGGPPAPAGPACGPSTPLGANRSAALGAGGPAGKGGGLTLRDPCYFPVTVTHDGHAWTQVGMRYKGNFSLMMGSLFAFMMGKPDGKLSFRLNFDRFEDAHPEIANQRFYGFKELTFSSNFDDGSRMREALANELFRDRGVAAPRVAFYRIVANTGSGDEAWGLYTLVEDPADSAMLVSQFGGSSGNLYKPDGPGADWTTFDRAGFEKKTNRATADFSDIQAAIDALHADLPAAAWRANLERHFDVDLFLRWLAVNQVVDNWDSYGRFAHNYYVYADPGRNGRLVWIPWDNNYAFGLIPFAANAAGIAGLVAQGGAGAPPAFQGPVPGGVPMLGSNGDVLFEKNVGQGWPLISRLLADPVYRLQYRAHLRFALGGLYERDRLAARIRQWQTLLASSVKSDKPASMFGGTDDFPAAIATLLTAVDRRRSLIEAALGR
jgi:spore coat protein H